MDPTTHAITDPSAQHGGDTGSHFTALHMKPPTFHMVLITFAFLISVILTVLLGLLAGWHIFLITTNRTTIEHYEGVMVGSSMLSEKPLGRHNMGLRGKHLYDLGPWSNFHQVLGSHVVHWGVPLTFMHGSGTHYPTNVGMAKAREGF